MMTSVVRDRCRFRCYYLMTSRQDTRGYTTAPYTRRPVF